MSLTDSTGLSNDIKNIDTAISQWLRQAPGRNKRRLKLEELGMKK